ncbi:hypothetical protein B0H14DRAFT_2637706 [Mycena olivaceomarginata]|nr:hypothetical protein B0H14DRAFT_2637706 [Mycena olivaceomarginata]
MFSCIGPWGTHFLLVILPHHTLKIKAVVLKRENQGQKTQAPVGPLGEGEGEGEGQGEGQGDGHGVEQARQEAGRGAWCRARRGEGQGEVEGKGKEGKEDNEEAESSLGKHCSIMLHCKYTLAKEYYEGLGEEEQVDLQKLRQDDYNTRFMGCKRAAQDETASNSEELADCRANTKTVSERTLEVLCSQMQCKGLLLLREIVETGEGEEEGGDARRAA